MSAKQVFICKCEVCKLELFLQEEERTLIDWFIQVIFCQESCFKQN